MTRWPCDVCTDVAGDLESHQVALGFQIGCVAGGERGERRLRHQSSRQDRARVLRRRRVVQDRHVRENRSSLTPQGTVTGGHCIIIIHRLWIRNIPERENAVSATGLIRDEAVKNTHLESGCKL